MTQEAVELKRITDELKAQNVPEETLEASRVLFVFGWPTPKIMKALAKSTAGFGITPEKKPKKKKVTVKTDKSAPLEDL